MATPERPAPASRAAVIAPIVVVVLYIASIVVNALISTGIGVPLTNRALSFAHPTLLTPPSFAFAIWGVIYLLVGAFCVGQVVPQWASDETLASIRPWVALALCTNCAWLFLFGNELLWLSFLVICTYLFALAKIVALVDLDLIDTSAPSYGPRLLALCAFSANASWVTVATLLQLQVNLLDEGYWTSEDLSVAMLCAAIAIGSYRALVWADVPWALVGGWALNAIRVNQQPGSDWGCLKGVCEACAEGTQRICTNSRPPPLGWASACAERQPQSDECVLERSEAVQRTCVFGLVCISVCLVLGIVRGVIAKRTAASRPRLAGVQAPGYRSM